MSFKMKCRKIGVHLKFSTYPHQLLFGVGGKTPTMSNSTLDYPKYMCQIVQKLIVGGGDSYGTPCMVLCENLNSFL